MRALCEALGEPQRSFTSLHVVGTNGKSSVTVLTAALLAATGLRVGACTSPHVWRWSERVRIEGAEIDAGAFGEAVDAVAKAIPEAERVLGDNERITQFEAAIAASFVALANARVEVGVIEAGLGGRLDATNVIPSTATALTSVGLDHVDWLGGTELEIAAEKLAVLQPGSILVLGRLSADVDALARSTAEGLGASVVDAPSLTDDVLPVGFAPYLARNAAVAVSLAETISGPLAPVVIRDVLAAAVLPGRAEVIGGDPPLLADAAHNQQGAAALAEVLAGFAAGRSVVGCLSILADKDAEAIVSALAPELDHCICTAAEPGEAVGRPGAKAADPEDLAGLLRDAGVTAEVVAEPAAAVERALAVARERSGVALCAGSHYLLRYVWTAKRAQNSSR